jgi:gamma-glutamyl:cysteine ligase YbdK (ATP-grasp superfamily)
VTVKQVDETFFELQAKHREYQAALNSIKHKCELAIEQSQLDADTKYKADSAEYKAVYTELLGRFTEWKHQQTVAIQKLKIIIPDNLKQIYEKVSALGK